MSPEEQKLCHELRDRMISKGEFLRQFPRGTSNGNLTRSILEEAIYAKNAEDLNCAMIIGFHFDFDRSYAQLLCDLIETDWHYSHEDLVSAIEKLQITTCISALYHATQWVPEYLEYDDSRALAVKAIWALWKLRTEESMRMLENISLSKDRIVRDTAIMLLNKNR